MTPLTPAEARDQLATADTLATTSGTDARIGVLIAVVLVMTRVLVETLPMPYVIIMGALASTVVGLIPLVALMRWHNRHVRVATRGFARRYVASFGVTMALCAIGIMWALSTPRVVFAPYCVLVALPMLLMATRMARR